MNRRAFTLLEVVVAIGMLLLLVSTLSSILWGAVRSGEELRTRMRRSTGVAAAFELLAAAADTCTARGRDGLPGIEGDGEHLRITRAVQSARDHSLDPIETLSFSTSPSEDGLNLVVTTASGGVESVLVEDAGGLRFRYHDGVGFQDTWDSAVRGLPRAIELSIWLGSVVSEEAPPDYRRLVAILRCDRE